MAIARPTPLLAPTPWCTLSGVSARAPSAQDAAPPPRAAGADAEPGARQLHPGSHLAPSSGLKPLRRAWSRSVRALGGARAVWAALDGVELWDSVCAGGSSFGEGSAALTWRLKLAPGEAVQRGQDWATRPGEVWGRGAGRGR